MSDDSIWTRIAAPIPPEEIQWRQDGKATARGAKFVARFVAYIDAQFVRKRLDEVVPGEWHLNIELLAVAEGGEPDDRYAFKAQLNIQGVEREDVGSGRDYKTASSDAFKRAAVRFGIAHELYAYEQNWVEVDGDGKYAKALQDPAEVYAKKHPVKRAAAPRPAADPSPAQSGERTPAPALFFGKPIGTPLGEYGDAALIDIINDCKTREQTAKVKKTIETARAIMADRSLGQPTTETERDARAMATLTKDDGLPPLPF